MLSFQQPGHQQLAGGATSLKAGGRVNTQDPEFIRTICVALDQTKCADNALRSQAEGFLEQNQKRPGFLPGLLQIVKSPEEVSQLTGFNGQPLDVQEVILRAVSLLKNLINHNWKITNKPAALDLSADKENFSANLGAQGQLQMAAQKEEDVSPEDKEFIKAHIYGALEIAVIQMQSKAIIAGIENIIWNIAETDFGDCEWTCILQSITQGLKGISESGQETGDLAVVVGLRALVEVTRAVHADPEIIPTFVKLMTTFLPQVGGILAEVGGKQSERQLEIMHLCAKVFKYAVRCGKLPCMTEPEAMRPWIDIFVSILDGRMPDGDPLQTKTTSMEQIQQLDASDWWRLKAIVCKISMSLYKFYTNDLRAFGGKKMLQSVKRTERNLVREEQEMTRKQFMMDTVIRLDQSHLGLIMQTTTQFVGSRALAISLKYVALSLRYKPTRDLIKPHFETILVDISLPLFMTSERDFTAFDEDPIEYVRASLDEKQERCVKRQMSHLVEKICALKLGVRGSRCKSEYLLKFMEMIAGHMQQHSGDLQAMEALLYAFGSLNDKYESQMSPELNNLTQSILESFVFPCLDSEIALVSSRATWVYMKFARFDFQKKEHLLAAVNKVVNHLHHPHLVVRVYAALALAGFLVHDEVAALIRPNLGNVLRRFLRIMDEIDLEELVKALSVIVNVYEDELAPYAVSLCKTLSEAYLRLLSQQGSADDQDGFPIDGLMKAIRQLLHSISGKFPTLYPQLEMILEQAIYASLSENGMTAADEGLTCIAELVYNQEQISTRMWGFFEHIINIHVQDRGIIDSHLAQAGVPLINFIVKAPDAFLHVQPGQRSALDLYLAFVQKTFQNAEILNTELDSLTAVTLIMALLEHLAQGHEQISQHLHQINMIYLNGMENAETPNYKNMLMQGIMMNFWYDSVTTLGSLRQLNKLDYVLSFIFGNLKNVQKDFEIKRLLIGLSALLMTPGQIDEAIQNKSDDIMQAILFLCESSLNLKLKAIESTARDSEECEEDANAEKDAIYDEDEHADRTAMEKYFQEDDLVGSDDDDEFDCDDEDDQFQLYDSKLDDVDDILFVQARLNDLHSQCNEQWEYLMGKMTPEQVGIMQNMFNQAQAMHDKINQEQAELRKDWNEQVERNKAVVSVDLQS